MGTNYYVIKDHCQCCGRSDREYHIGKSSHGWAFTFQGYQLNKLDSWKQWKAFLLDQHIQDEYGDAVPYETFCDMVETYKSPSFHLASGAKNLSHRDECKRTGDFNAKHDWEDADGYSFTDMEFS